MIAIGDPTRPLASLAVGLARRAGIRLFLVTDDHPATAEAVGRQVGLLPPLTASGGVPTTPRPDQRQFFLFFWLQKRQLKALA
jgi:magnesium-transporting ATPase (P-type)